MFKQITVDGRAKPAAIFFAVLALLLLLRLVHWILSVGWLLVIW